MLMPMIITAMSKWRRTLLCPNAQTFDCYANTNHDAEDGNNENIKYSAMMIAVSNQCQIYQSHCGLTTPSYPHPSTSARFKFISNLSSFSRYLS